MYKEDVCIYNEYIHTMKYYSTTKNEILPFATTWMDLEGIMLNEKSQEKAISTWSHLYVDSKNQNKQNEMKWKETNREGWDGQEIGEGD